MSEQFAIDSIVNDSCSGCYGSDEEPGRCKDCGYNKAMNALKAQIKLKEYIERLNQPEYNGVVWQKDEVVLLLKELVVK